MMFSLLANAQEQSIQEQSIQEQNIQEQNIQEQNIQEQNIQVGHGVLCDTVRQVERFVALRDNLDLSTPSGRLMFHVIGAMAEFERSLIQERVKAGLRNARAKGTRLGRPRANVDAARITRLRSQGRTVREIADELGYSRSLVHKTLANGESRRVANAAS